jgi:adenosylhomocysteine nucleosidase
VIAILSALAEEQSGLITQLEDATSVSHGGREFWTGTLHRQSVVLALSRIGKVAAATTVAALIDRFQASCVMFTGVAGGVDDGVAVGDVVVATSFIQHDMDASPLFPKYQVPLTGKTIFACDEALCNELARACRTGLTTALHGNRPPHIHSGLIASGDRFVSGAHEVAALVRTLEAHGHHPLAVEMEGAAVAQVCHDYGVAFAAVRTISDRADDTAHVDFPHFVTTVASVYARNIVNAWLPMLSIQ